MEVIAEEVSVHIDDMVSKEEEQEREDGEGVEEAQQTVTKNLNRMDSLELEAGKISVMRGASKVSMRFYVSLSRLLILRPYNLNV